MTSITCHDASVPLIRPRQSMIPPIWQRHVAVIQNAAARTSERLTAACARDSASLRVPIIPELDRGSDYEATSILTQRLAKRIRWRLNRDTSPILFNVILAAITHHSRHHNPTIKEPTAGAGVLR